MADVTDTFYPAEDAVPGYGAQVEVGDGSSPEEYEAVAGVRNIKPGEIGSADKDRTHLRSPDRHKEHASGMRDSGAIEFDGIYLKGAQSLTQAGGGSGAFQNGGLPAMAEDGLNRNFRIRMNDGSPETAVIVRGYVSKFSLGEINSDGDLTYNAAIMPARAYDHP